MDPCHIVAMLYCMVSCNLMCVKHPWNRDMFNVFILVPCVNFLILEGKALKRLTRKLWGCLFAVMNCGFVCVSQKSICWLTCTLQIIGRTPLHFAESKSQVYYFLLQVMHFWATRHSDNKLSCNSAALSCSWSNTVFLLVLAFLPLALTMMHGHLLVVDHLPLKVFPC